MIGKTFQQFKILREIGRGGLGVVFLAYDEKLNRKVALKFLKTSQEHGDKILGEARAAGKLSHPGIVTIYDVQNTAEGPCIVMEYVEGESLEEHLRISDLSPARALELSIKILEIIDFAHKNKLIHGDLKPTNIIIDQNGMPKLLDFGLACADASSNDSGNTSGTFPYLAPEQIMGMPGSEQSDLYAFGVILYQLFTGEYPFQMDNHAAFIFAAVNQEPVPPQNYNKKLPDQLNTVILKCLDKNPSARFSGAGSLISALKNISAGQPQKMKPFPIIFGAAVFALILISILMVGSDFFNEKTEYIQSPGELYVANPVYLHFIFPDKDEDPKNAINYTAALIELLRDYFGETSNIRTSGIHDEVFIPVGSQKYDYLIQIKTLPFSTKKSLEVTISDKEGEVVRRFIQDWLDLESTVSLSQKLFCEVMGIVMGHEIIFRPPENKVKSRTNLLKAKNYGISYYNNGEYALAIKKFESILANDPENIAALYHKGLCLKALGNYPEAIESLSATMPGLMIRNFFETEKKLTQINEEKFQILPIYENSKKTKSKAVLLRQPGSLLLQFFNMESRTLIESLIDTAAFGEKNDQLYAIYYCPDIETYVIIVKGENYFRTLLLDKIFQFVQARNYSGKFESFSYPFLYYKNLTTNLFEVRRVDINNPRESRLIEIPSPFATEKFLIFREDPSFLVDGNELIALDFGDQEFRKIRSATKDDLEIYPIIFGDNPLMISYNDSVIHIENIRTGKTIKALKYIMPSSSFFGNNRKALPFVINAQRSQFYTILPDSSLYLAKFDQGNLVCEYATKLPAKLGGISKMNQIWETDETEIVEVFYLRESGKVLYVYEKSGKIFIEEIKYSERSWPRVYKIQNYIFLRNRYSMQIYDTPSLRLVRSVQGELSFIQEDRKNNIIVFWNSTDNKFNFFNALTSKWTNYVSPYPVNLRSIFGRDNRVYFNYGNIINEINIDNLVQNFPIDPATVHYHLADCYFLDGDYDNCIVHLKTVLDEIQPNNELAIKLQLKAQLLAGKYHDFLSGIYYYGKTSNASFNPSQKFKTFLKDKGYVGWEYFLGSSAESIKIKTTNNYLILSQSDKAKVCNLNIFEKKSGQPAEERTMARFLNFATIPNTDKIVYCEIPDSASRLHFRLFNLKNMETEATLTSAYNYTWVPGIKYHQGNFYVYKIKQAKKGVLEQIDFKNRTVKTLVETDRPFIKPIFEDERIHFLTEKKYYCYYIRDEILTEKEIEFPGVHNKFPHTLLDLHQNQIRFLAGRRTFALDTKSGKINQLEYSVSQVQIFRQNRKNYYFDINRHEFLTLPSGNKNPEIYFYNNYTFFVHPNSIEVYQAGKFVNELPVFADMFYSAFHFDDGIIYFYGKDQKLYALDINFKLEYFKNDLILALE